MAARLHGYTLAEGVQWWLRAGRMTDKMTSWKLEASGSGDRAGRC